MNKNQMLNKFLSLFINSRKELIRRLCFLIIIVVVLLIDRLTKKYLFGESDPKSNWWIIAFNEKFVLNRGSAFNSMLGMTLLLKIIAISYFIIALILTFSKLNIAYIAPLLMMASGGFSNSIDRFIYGGKVRDFVSFPWWEKFPIFNIADCFAVVGVFSLLLVAIIRTFKNNSNNQEKMNNEQ